MLILDVNLEAAGPPSNGSPSLGDPILELATEPRLTVSPKLSHFVLVTSDLTELHN